MNSEGVSIGGDLDRTVWAKQYLNSFIAWCNYIELGCPDCRGSEWVPLGTYQSGTLARPFTDRLLGEVVEFGSLDLIFGQLQCQGGRRAVSFDLQVAMSARLPTATWPVLCRCSLTEWLFPPMLEQLILHHCCTLNPKP